MSEGDVGAMFDALNDERRRELFRLLVEKREEKTTAELAGLIEAPVEHVRTHLKILEGAELVTRRPKGRETFWRVLPEYRRVFVEALNACGVGDMLV